MFRQAAESRIIVNAHRINRELMPEWVQNPASDFHFIECVLQIVRERIPRRYGLDPICDIQLWPMNRSGLGARSLNLDLQQGAEPIGRTAWRALQLDVRHRRQGDVGRKRL